MREHSPLNGLGSSFSALLSFQVSSAKNRTDSDLYFHVLHLCSGSIAWGGYQGENICQHMWRGRFWHTGSKQHFLIPLLIFLLIPNHCPQLTLLVTELCLAPKDRHHFQMLEALIMYSPLPARHGLAS